MVMFHCGSEIVTTMISKTKKKLLFIIGATGTGKTKLSIDLAVRFSGEIINSDKIQFYKGLDITTNKVPMSDRCGIPHHLLGFINDPEADFSVKDFCESALVIINEIISNGNLPIIVGGSNTYIKALVESVRVNFECCFIWMDVLLSVLYDYIEKRVDHMVKEGMVEEIREIYSPDADYGRGIRRAIGAPEMDLYFKIEKYIEDEDLKKVILKGAFEKMKVNTCKLVDCQLGKIRRLRDYFGWEMHRIDATCVFEKYGKKSEIEDAWKEHVLKPILGIMSDFFKKKNKEIIGGETQFSSPKIIQFPQQLPVAN